MRPSVFVRTQYWYVEGVPVATNFHRSSCRQYGNAKLKNNRIWTCRFPLVPPMRLPCATAETEMFDTTTRFSQMAQMDYKREGLLSGSNHFGIESANRD